MARCTSCGTDLPDAAKFCFNCGQTVAAPTCSSCGADLVPGARFCMNCGATVEGEQQPVDRPQARVSSRRVTSILFADLVGFTTLSEARDQEDVRELLARYFDEARRIVTRYGGQVEKYIGDAVMAVWGVPTSREDDAERAVRAGLELVSMIRDLGVDVGIPQLAMRVGVVTGEVAVTEGAAGQGMVAGDPVNTASRVQSAAQPGQVWVDETTRILTSAAITYADVGSHELKGKAEPVPLWSALAVVAALGGAQRADGLEAPLVGRDRELRLVKELFHRSEETHQPVLLVVEGEPGVGKTRLGWELEKYADGLETNTWWHSGRCVAYGEGVAYFALAEAFRGRLLALADSEGETDDAALLDKALDTYVADDEERAWMRPRLGALLGIGSVGTFSREDLFSAWTAFLGGVGGGDAVVLLIDDAHQADDGLLMFIEHLLDNAQFGCFVLMLSRTGLLAAHPTLVSRPQCNVVHLSALTGSDTARMLDGLVGGLPQKTRDALVARAEGLPLFAVETVRSLIDRDLIVPRGGHYVLVDDSRVDVTTLEPPASLHALLAARIDALTPEQRLVVERASVLGTSFPPDRLGWICPDIDDLDGVLADLVRLQILTRETSRLSAEFGDFRFAHSAVQQVAYGTLSRRDRKAIHLAVAARLEDEGGDETSAIRAQHYLDALTSVPDTADGAELRERALAALRVAAARARDLGSLAEAARHLAAAADLTSDDRIRGRVMTDRAIAELDASDFEAAATHAREAEEILIGAGDRVTAGLAVAVRGGCLIEGDSKTEQGLELLQQWWDELQGRDDATETLLLLSLWIVRGREYAHEYVDDVLHARMQLAERAGEMGELALCFTRLAVHYGQSGLMSLMRVLFEAAADLARRHHDLPALGLALTNAAAFQTGDDVEGALAAATDAVAAASRTGIPRTLEVATANLELGLVAAGRWDELRELEVGSRRQRELLDPAREAIRGMVALARGTDWKPIEHRSMTNDDVGNAWVLFIECLVAMLADDRQNALSQARAAVETVYGESVVWDDLAHMWLLAFELALELGDEPLTASLFTMCEEHASQLPRGLRAEWAHGRALVAIRDGRADEVEPLLREAIEHYDTWGAVPHAARAKSVLGRWLREQGREDEAAGPLTEARETFMALGANAWLAELEEPLLQAAAAR